MERRREGRCRESEGKGENGLDIAQRGEQRRPTQKNIRPTQNPEQIHVYIGDAWTATNTTSIRSIEEGGGDKQH